MGDLSSVLKKAGGFYKKGSENLKGGRFLKITKGKENIFMETIVVVKAAVVDVKKTIETSASKLNSSEVVSLLDACTCTGNCC